MKNVLSVTGGLFHPPLWGRMSLHRNLAQMEGFVFQHVPSLERVASMETGPYTAMVLYFHHKVISDEALNTLDEFVKLGGGLLAVHSATASFKQSERYSGILGGRFTGHGEVVKMDVESVPGRNEPFEGIDKFSVKDELYLHETQPGIRVHFTTAYRGDQVPVVWTNGYGDGRVCYVMPGHLSDSMRHPVVQQILRRGLEWVSQR